MTSPSDPHIIHDPSGLHPGPDPAEGLDFRAAEIGINPFERTFPARVGIPGPANLNRRHGEFSGHWAVARGPVVTAIHVADETSSLLHGRGSAMTS
jgi:hypothetical protein